MTNQLPVTLKLETSSKNERKSFLEYYKDNAQKNDVYVFDRGYTDLKLFNELNKKSFFICRLKKDSSYICKDKTDYIANVNNSTNIDKYINRGKNI